MRTHLFAAASLSVLMLAGCVSQKTPAAVANDVALEASALQSVLPQLSAGLPAAKVATASQAIADLTAVSAAFAAADDATQKALVLRIEADVNKVVAVAAGLPFPPPIPSVLQAAVVLLPVIEASVGMVVVASASPNAMSCDQARIILAGAR